MMAIGMRSILHRCTDVLPELFRCSLSTFEVYREEDFPRTGHPCEQPQPPPSLLPISALSYPGTRPPRRWPARAHDPNGAPDLKNWMALALPCIGAKNLVAPRSRPDS